jgi:soluble lytic murein transglycosylase-like protein
MMRTGDKDPNRRENAMSKIPEAKALQRRAEELWKESRPSAIRLAVAFGLMAPAAVMMATERHESRQELEQVAAEFEAEAVNEAWQEHVLERERVYITAGFARKFNIPFDLAVKIHEAARDENIEPHVAFGLVKAESSFRTRASSPVGALGLTQVMPATARWMVPGTTRNDLLDPETNLRVGFKYLRYLYDKYDGDERLALTAYNRGPGTVAKAIRQGRNPENGYADMVLTGESKQHVALMNARFGGRSRS